MLLNNYIAAFITTLVLFSYLSAPAQFPQLPDARRFDNNPEEVDRWFKQCIEISISPKLLNCYSAKIVVSKSQITLVD
ncbi:hypothetical protein [Microseira sp. BLCC-F43]|jgi:hypothetical protein|uniref:hypothetical protein n=1 Tax=Microseira sp. BLCC-F43 TaxID=3153602 RepID=UPI0035B91410